MPFPARLCVLYGYRIGDPDIVRIINKQIVGDVRKRVKITLLRESAKERVPVAFDLGLFIQGFVLAVSDVRDRDTAINGFQIRLACLDPCPMEWALRRMFMKASWFCHRFLTPLLGSDDYGFWTWFDKTHFGCADLRRFIRESEQFDGMFRCSDVAGCREAYPVLTFAPSNDELLSTTTFQKKEMKITVKSARNIQSPTNACKALFGPYIQRIEERLYDVELNGCRCFIKHVPVRLRGQYILEHLGIEGARYMVTDHSHYESHFRPEIIRNCEGVLYRYMLRDCPPTIVSSLLLSLEGLHRMHCPTWKAEILGCRMSGHDVTSCGNGFTNLILVLTVLDDVGAEDVAVCVEGDDGIARFRGTVPGVDAFASYGFDIKMEAFDDVCRCCFCGIMASKETMHNLVDPITTLLKFGWTFSLASSCFERMSLLRSKALSLLWGTPSCPIIAAFARRVLMLTRSVYGHFVSTDRWHEQFLFSDVVDREQLPATNIEHADRVLMEEFSGIAVEEQLMLEGEFEGMLLGPFRSDLLITLIMRRSESTVWEMLWKRYVHDL